MTSMPGLTAAARWMMTASVMEDVIQTRSAKVSTAHAMTSRAGASARSFAAWAAFAASSCCRAASVLSPAVTWSGYVGLVALNLTGRLPSVKRSRSRPYSPCNHTPRRKCSHVRPPGCRYPGRLGLSLPDPGHRGLGRLARRLVLAVTPVTARALFVMRSAAGGADHGAIFCPGFPVHGTGHLPMG